MDIRKKGVFTLSLDCEGLWGMADSPQVVAGGVINDDALNMAYDHILSALGKYNLTATAAFVSAFAVDSDILRDNMELLEQLGEFNPTWFASIVPAVRNGSLNGWNGSNLYRSLASAGLEIAWHGATHLPLSQEISEQSVAIEIELASRLFASLGRRPRTVVFPRNQIGHLEQLRRAGFENYRDGLRRDRLAKVTNLLGEFNVMSACDVKPPKLDNGWRVSRPGDFLNWPSGFRATVPISATIRRWKSKLRDAAHRGGSVHMWFHPHNLITAPAMKTSFDEIMRFAGELTRAGNLSNLTMAQSLAYLDHEPAT